MKTIGILTSGGDAPGMNAAIRAIVRAGIYNGHRMMGIRLGYHGLINGMVDEMNLSSVGDIIHRGGTMLRTARADDFLTEEGFNKAMNVLRVFGIEGLIVMGGDGTFKGAQMINDAGVPTVAIPCTIDNDLGYTDYSIGFHTAVETVVDAIGKIRDTSTSHGRANIVEVMGRNCGDLALYSGLAGGAESIIVPEKEYNLDEVVQRVIQGRNRGKLHNIIILAEGVGNVYEVADAVIKKTGVDTRVTVLGHIQRGGSPSSYDRILASNMGMYALDLVMNNQGGLALGIKCNKIFHMDLDEALKVKKEFNNDMYEAAKILSI